MNDQSEQQPITVLGLRAERFKRLQAVELRFDGTGEVVQVRGKNGHGKSSVLDAIWAALGGKRASPQQPINEGAERAEVTLDLGDLTVRRRWTDPADASKSTLVVQTKDGASYPSPQSVLDALMGHFVDPVRFAELNDPERAREVLDMVEIGIDLDQSIADERKWIEKRKASRDRIRELESHIGRLAEAADGAPEERVDVAALAEELTNATTHNARKEGLAAQVRKATESVSQAAGQVEQLDAEEKQLLAKLEELRTQRRPAAQQEHKSSLEFQLSAEAELDRFAPVDVDEIRGRIAGAEEENRKLEAAVDLEARRADLAEERERLEEVNQNIKAYREERLRALGKVEFPVEGMGYDADAGVVTLNGHPFDDASQAEKLNASAELAMAQSPRLRVLLARQGSLLDSDHREQLARLVESRGFQLFLEVVDDTQEGAGVWIEEGAAYGPHSTIAEEVEA